MASAFRHAIHGLKAVAIQGSADEGGRCVRRTLSPYSRAGYWHKDERTRSLSIAVLTLIPY